jgi:hypothetical protein
MVRLKRNGINHIDRYAVVGGPSWIDTVIGIGAPMVKMEIEHFDLDEEDKAVAWLKEQKQPQSKGIRTIPTSNSAVVAFGIEDRLTAEDYDEIVIPALKKAGDEHGQYDLLIRFDDFKWGSLGAMAKDATLINMLSDMRRIAFVTPPDWVEGAVKMVKPLLQAEVRSFNHANEAWEWLGAQPV